MSKVCLKMQTGSHAMSVAIGYLCWLPREFEYKGGGGYFQVRVTKDSGENVPGD